MANQASSELITDEPEPSVIQRVAQALEDTETGEAAPIVFGTDGETAPLPSRPRQG